MPFTIVTSGAQIWNTISGALQTKMVVAEVAMAQDRADLAHEVLATLADWNEAAGDVHATGYRAVRAAIKDVEGQLKDLFDADLVLLARRIPRRLEGGVGVPVSWDVAELIIRPRHEVAQLLEDRLGMSAEAPGRTDEGRESPGTGPR